ncbi:hypothetical protein [Dyadobacter linearis]|nr:hypothetical protein [Dyadobacter sp. CECT 9623]
MMRSLTRLFLMVLLGGCELVNAQQVYQVGVASESLEPGEESFSVALSGYAGPWAGRFAFTWLPKGLKSSNPAISRSIPKVGKGSVQTAVVGKVTYKLDSKGNITAGKSGKSLPALPGITGFVVKNNDMYAAAGSDTLYRLHLPNPERGWMRAAYHNGQIPRVVPKEIFVSQDKLYAITKTDSLFEAAVIHGKEPEQLFARALALKSEQSQVLLMCLDLCGFDGSFINEIKKDIAKKHRLPEEAILINASHTHFAPGTQKWLTWAPHNRYPDEAYMNKVVRPAMLKAADRALASSAPSYVKVGRGTTAIGRNRSNGELATPYDNAVDVLTAERTDGSEKTVMVLSGCHPVAGTAGIKHFTVSSNYPGFMRNALEEAGKIKTTALFMQGCAGDINPIDEPEITGAKLAADALKVMDSNMKPLSGPVTFHMDSVLAETTPWSKEKLVEFRETNSKLGAQMEPERNVAWADLMLSHLEQNTMPKSMPVYIQTINIGEWKLIGLSREVVTEYGLAIKKLWPEKLVSVAGYCNDVSSYLPVERHIKTRVYEGEGSCFWYGLPSVFPLDILDRVVNRISTKNY